MMKKILIAIIAILMAPAVSFACSFTFDVSLVSTTLDATRSANNTLGFDNWYVWKYRVDVVSGNTNPGSYHNGHQNPSPAFSDWELQLPDCYIVSPSLFHEIEASADQGGGDQIRVYNFEGKTTNDLHFGFKGLKWDLESGDQLNEIGEYDYFWFSAPTDQSIEKDWGLKAGTNILRGDVDVPACPECGHQNPGVPERL